MTEAFSSQKYYSNKQYIYFWAANNFLRACIQAQFSQTLKVSSMVTNY